MLDVQSWRERHTHRVRESSDLETRKFDGSIDPGGLLIQFADPGRRKGEKQFSTANGDDGPSDNHGESGAAVR